MFNMSYY